MCAVVFLNNNSIYFNECNSVRMTVICNLSAVILSYSSFVCSNISLKYNYICGFHSKDFQEVFTDRLYSDLHNIH